MSYCQQCGQPVNSHFCSNCGAPTAPTATAATTAQPPMNQSPAAPLNAPAPQPPYAPPYGQPQGQPYSQPSQPSYAQQAPVYQPPVYPYPPQPQAPPVYINNVNTNTAGGFPYAPKSKIAALLLCIFLGMFGVHRFYVGKVGTGLLYLFTCGLWGVGFIVDIIMIATGGFRDKNGMFLR